MRWPDAGAGAPGKSPKPRTDKLLDVVVDEAAVLDAPLHANTTPRIAFLRHLIALLESQPDTPFLGQLKTLLTGPELPVASDVAVPWDIAYFIEFLKPKLGEHHLDKLDALRPAEFLTALVAALNDRAKLPDLDRFPDWHDQPPLPLDAPWPD